MAEKKNYTIGKGKLLIKLSGELGYRELGNVSEFKVNSEAEVLEHFNSEGGLKTKDADIPIGNKASFSFVADELKIENLQLFFMSITPVEVVQALGTASEQVVTAVHDRFIPMGKNKVSSVVVKDSAGTTTYVLNTDYKLNTEEGLFMALSTGAIEAAESLKVDYSYAAETRTKISVATKTSQEGDIMFIGDPPHGQKWTGKGYGTIIPAGEVSWIGDEVAKLSFKGEFLQNANYAGLIDWYNRGQVTS